MISFTVFFEGPFWVGVFERTVKNKLFTAKVTFGAEPNDDTVYNYILTESNKLRFSTALNIEQKNLKKPSFKRQQREAKKATQEKGIGTKAQQALKLDRDFRKQEHKQNLKAKQELLKEKKFLQKQQKKKQKKKGH
ncbi:YjdF family protein [Clostridium sp. 'deep sea']|uniref:YjdF family protein n=1 Tax=Clostridium sp. 'deep sea' TaxID=2779445 RepID=UPI0018964678|nr:YjdF family protein [Clostridium sp. 'deep sea']QOR35495.1 YjdF family protein [Clostridium sp. 'deep sea']